MIDFTPTKENISLHGLGFIQIKLGDKNRLHVWHPGLPRRSCYNESAIHNHRFSFRSTVMHGQQVNVRCERVDCHIGAFDIINHNGPRSERGGRISFVDGHCNIIYGDVELYCPGDSYIMDELEYHHTPNNGFVITFLEKLTAGSVHASSIIKKGVTFDQSFDRFQLSPDQLWAYVREAFEAC